MKFREFYNKHEFAIGMIRGYLSIPVFWIIYLVNGTL